MVVIQKPVTSEEMFMMPNGNVRRELVRGEVRWTELAEVSHGRVTVNVATSLYRHAHENGLGFAYAAGTGFKIASGPDTVRAPDVAFVRRESLEEVGEVEGYWPGAPDLAVEVVSPTDLYTEVEEKVADWLESGVRMVVIVNPRNKTVTVRRSESEITVLGEDDTLNGGETVPGWSLPVRDVFQ